MSERTDLKHLAGRFDAFLVDQFGVLLSGSGAYPFAPAALSRLASSNERIVLLSNSGKRSEPNVKRLLDLGFERDSFITVLSSGEVARGLIEARLGQSIPRGGKVHVLSREGDQSCIDALDLHATEDPSTADMIVIAGRDSDDTTLSDYEARLSEAARRGVPCICTNPDQIMLTPNGSQFGPGRIARLFEEMGGFVEWIGKPHPAMYEAALDLLDHPRPERVLCIGDSPAHDIAGGRNAGLATALVRTGIHADISDDEIDALCRKEGAIPDFIIPKFDF